MAMHMGAPAGRNLDKPRPNCVAFFSRRSLPGKLPAMRFFIRGSYKMQTHYARATKTCSCYNDLRWTNIRLGMSRSLRWAFAPSTNCDREFYRLPRRFLSMKFKIFIDCF